MREGMSYSITWKYRQVMIMAQKKDRSRFTIKFRESDPAHDMTIRILEKQGQRNIAPFLVNSVLHYVQCSETPDMSHMLVENPQPVMDKTEIEDMVKEILRQQGIIKEEQKPESGTFPFMDIKMIRDIKDGVLKESNEKQKVVNDDMRAMIARTLSSFRNE